MMDSNTEQLELFLSNFSNQTINVWVSDPKTEKEAGMLGAKYFLTYNVGMKQQGRDSVTVRHRFSDFEALRKNLAERYPPVGIFVPSLPPKHLFLSTKTTNAADDPLIRERILGLQLFLEKLVSSPWLRNDSSWKNFMKSPGYATTSGINQGEIMLYAALSQLNIDSGPTTVQQIFDFKTDVITTEKVTKAALEQAKVVQSNERTLESNLISMNSAIKQCILTETGNTSSFQNNNLLRQSKVLSHETPDNTLKRVSELLDTNLEAITKPPQPIGFSLITMLMEDLAVLEALKDVLTTHDELRRMIDSTQAKIRKLETSSASGKDAQLFDLRNMLREKDECLNAFHKGFVYFTIPAALRQRAASIRKIAGLCAASKLTNSFAMMKASQLFFEHANMNISSAVSNSNSLLEFLSLRPLDILPSDITNNSKSLDNEYSTDLSITSNYDVLHEFNKSKSASYMGDYREDDELVEEIVIEKLESPEKPLPNSRTGLVKPHEATNSSTTADNDNEVRPATPVEIEDKTNVAIITDDEDSGVNVNKTAMINDKAKSLISDLTSSDNSEKNTSDADIWN